MLSCCVLVKAHNVTRLRFLVQVQKTCVYTATKDNTYSHCTAEEIANRDLTLSGTSDYQTAITLRINMLQSDAKLSEKLLLVVSGCQ